MPLPPPEQSPHWKALASLPARNMGGSPAYMAAVGSNYHRLADMVWVVGDKELLVHSHVVAKECRVIQDLCCAQSDRELAEEGLSEGPVAPATPPPGDSSTTTLISSAINTSSSGTASPRAAPSAAAAAAAAAVSMPRNGLLRLEDPFADFDHPEAELLLTCLYEMSGASAQFARAAAGGEAAWGGLVRQAVRLADFLGAPRLLAAADAGLAGALPQDSGRVQAWLPALAVADAFQVQLPLLYAATLRLAVAAFCQVSDDCKSGGMLPPQHLLLSAAGEELSAATWRAISAGLLGALRKKCLRPELSWQEAGRGAVLGLAEHSGSAAFTWNWKPGYALDDPNNAKQRQESEVFTLAGCKWRLIAYVSKIEGQSWLSVFLAGVPEEAGQVVARHARVRFTIEGKEDETNTFPDFMPVNVNGRGYQKFLLVSDLLDVEKGFMEDGRIRITTEILSMRCLDV